VKDHFALSSKGKSSSYLLNVNIYAPTGKEIKMNACHNSLKGLFFISLCTKKQVRAEAKAS